MAGIQASGAGSGIDINSLVNQLVAAERAPLAARIDREARRVETQLSALGTLRGALSTLHSSLSGSKTDAAFRPRKAQVADGAAVGATTSPAAAAGRYRVEVLALASAHRLASAAFAGGSAATVGTGTLTLAIGGSAFSVAVAEPNHSVAGIRDAINSAAGNTGVQATVINAVDGARLVLTSTKSGAGGALRVTASGGDGGLAALVYDPGTLTNLTQTTAAQDASVRIEGFTVASPTNSISGAIDGVTLDLRTAAPGAPVDVVVTTDTTASLDKIRKLVADYNTALGTMSQLRSFDASTRAAGPMLGDSMLRAIESRLRAEALAPTAGVSAAFANLPALGIRTGADGKLTIDEARLSAALGADFDAVARALGGSGGIASRLHAVVDSTLQAGGQLATRSNDLQASRKGVTDDRARLDLRMEQVERRYRAQFVAMDRLLTELQATGNYLTQQLKNLPGSTER